MRARGTAALALLLTLALMLTGCSSDSGEPGKVEPSSSDGEATAVTAEQLTALFAGAGIATYGEASAKAPVRATETTGRVRLLGWQVETMTRQLNAKRGYRGTDLDALHPAAALSVPPISVVLAAYVKAGKTPGAEASRTLMGDQDFARHAREIVYPDAVLAFFVNDLAAGPAAHPAPATGTSCNKLQDFLSGALGSVVASLGIDSAASAGGMLATIWSTVVEIAAASANLTLPPAATAPVVGVIKQATALLAVLSSAGPLLDPWAVTSTGDPDPAHAAIGSTPNDVAVTTDVKTAVGFSWPADVRDCARAARVALPDPAAAQGSPVIWTVQADPAVAVAAEKDAQVGADGTAVLHLRTGTEKKEDHEKGELVSSPVAVSTDLVRTRIKNLLDLVEAIFVDGLPGPDRSVLTGLLGPPRSSTRTELAALLSVRGPATWLTVNHHEPAPTTPPVN